MGRGGANKNFRPLSIFMPNIKANKGFGYYKILNLTQNFNANVICGQTYMPGGGRVYKKWTELDYYSQTS